MWDWNELKFWEKVYFRSQTRERPSIGEYWNIFGRGGVLNFELGADVRPEFSTTTL